MPGVADPIVGLKLALTAAVRESLVDPQLLAEFLLTVIHKKVMILYITIPKYVFHVCVCARAGMRLYLCALAAVMRKSLLGPLLLAEFLLFFV